MTIRRRDLEGTARAGRGGAEVRPCASACALAASTLLLLLLGVPSAHGAGHAEGAPQQSPGTAEAESEAGSEAPDASPGDDPSSSAELPESTKSEGEPDDYPTDPAEMWALLLDNQSHMHTLAQTERFTVEIMERIAELAGEEALILSRIYDAAPVDELGRVKLRRSALVGIITANSVRAAANSHVPGSLPLPLQRFDKQLKVVEDLLPAEVLRGRSAREPSKARPIKIR